MNEQITAAAVSALVAVPTGIFSCYLFWLYQTRFLSPRIQWSDFISINSEWPGGPSKFRIKVMNTGSRAVVEVSAVCMLRVRGVGTGGNWKLVSLRTLDVPLPRLEPRAGRVITVKTDGLNTFHVAGLPESIRGLFNQNPPVGLDEVLRIFPDSEMVLYLSAYDEKSGTRKHFRSHAYTWDSFTHRLFRADGTEIEDRGAV